MIERVWEIRDYDLVKAQELANAMTISPFLARIMVMRGYEHPIVVRQMLFPDLADLHDPFHFEDMGLAIERVERAIDAGEKILIYGDSDVDGVTSTALVHRYLSHRTPHVSCYVTGNEGYGLQMDKLREFCEQGVQLIISVDCGITNFDEAELLATKGVDLIILDHHEMRDVLPRAVAIIDAKVPGCGYPFRDLAGVGTALKFITGCFIATQRDIPAEYVAIDVETTGLDPLQAEMIEMAAVRFRHGRPVEAMSSLICPQGTIPAEITTLTGISDAECRQAPPLDTVLDSWLAFCGDSALVGHNIDFDYSFIKKALKQTGRKKLKNRLIDTLPLARSLVQSVPNHKLETLVHQFGLSHSGMHRARKDAEQTGRLLSILEYRRLQTKIIKFTNYFLDLVCLGTIADVVPLVRENRVLTRYGLDRIRKSPSIGLKMLLDRQKGSEQPISSRDIAWGIAPIINSAGRAGKAADSFELLTTTNKHRARDLVSHLRDVNNEQKENVQKMFQAFQARLAEQVDLEKDRVIILMVGHHETSITGVVANRFLNAFGRPVFLVTWNDEQAVGSARAASSIDLTAILEQCSPLLVQFGGHKRAAGFSLKPENVHAFRNRLLQVVNEHVAEQDLVPHVVIDLPLIPEEFSASFLDDLLLLEPFGEEHPPPLFAMYNVIPFEISSFGQDSRHLRLLIDAGDRPVGAIYWNMGHRAEELKTAACPLDIAFCMERNVWKNRVDLNLIVEHLRIHT